MRIFLMASVLSVVTFVCTNVDAADNYPPIRSARTFLDTSTLESEPVANVQDEPSGNNERAFLNAPEAAAASDMFSGTLWGGYWQDKAAQGGRIGTGRLLDATSSMGNGGTGRISIRRWRVR